MAHDSFFISDTHFGPENAWKVFKGPDGVSPLRPFSSTEEMDETMVANWNRVVRPQDYVYHLGDVAIKKQYLSIVGRLNGHKRLIMGNHDNFDLKEYMKHFEKVKAYQILDRFIFSHVPIHPGSLSRWSGNVHGHTHANVVNIDDAVPDPRYLCVSVEHTDYTPVNLEWVIKKFKERGLYGKPRPADAVV